MILLLLLLVLVVTGLFLGGRNAQPVVLDYYAGTIELTLSVALVMALLAGILLGAAAVWLGSVIRLQARVRRLRRQVESSPDPSVERLTADR